MKLLIKDNSFEDVIPVKTGIHKAALVLDSHFRGNVKSLNIDSFETASIKSNSKDTSFKGYDKIMTFLICFLILVSNITFLTASDSYSGNLARFDKDHWMVFPTDDNLDSSLSTTFRSWWYVKIDSLPLRDTSYIEITGEGWSSPRFSPPVFSYDGKKWEMFKYSDVTNMLKYKDGARTLHKYRLTKVFTGSSVRIARYQPYNMNDLESLIKSLSRDPLISKSIIGKSPGDLPIYMLTLTNPKVKDSLKKRILVHSRTHPSETACSFVAEGLITSLLSKHNRKFLDSLIFNIIPILNPDGVELGTSRNNISGDNLEESWKRDKGNELFLDTTCPLEVLALNQLFISFMDSVPKVIAAVNLHSFNAPYALKAIPFVFSNFRDWNKYNSAGKSLWIKQAKFLKFLNENYCLPIIGRSNPKTTNRIEDKEFPESWWWTNFKDSVMAVTLESTPEMVYCEGLNGINEANLRLGDALAKTLIDYYNYFKVSGFNSVDESIGISDLYQYWESIEYEGMQK